MTPIEPQSCIVPILEESVCYQQAKFDLEGEIGFCGTFVIPVSLGNIHTSSFILTRGPPSSSSPHATPPRLLFWAREEQFRGPAPRERHT